MGHGKGKTRKEQRENPHTYKPRKKETISFRTRPHHRHLLSLSSPLTIHIPNDQSQSFHQRCQALFVPYAPIKSFYPAIRRRDPESAMIDGQCVLRGRGGSGSHRRGRGQLNESAVEDGGHGWSKKGSI